MKMHVPRNAWFPTYTESVLSKIAPPHSRQQKLNSRQHEYDVIEVCKYSYARQKGRLGVEKMSLEHRHLSLFPDFRVTKDYQKCLIFKK